MNLYCDHVRYNIYHVDGNGRQILVLLFRDWSNYWRVYTWVCECVSTVVCSVSEGTHSAVLAIMVRVARSVGWMRACLPGSLGLLAATETSRQHTRLSQTNTQLRQWSSTRKLHRTFECNANVRERLNANSGDLLVRRRLRKRGSPVIVWERRVRARAGETHRRGVRGNTDGDALPYGD